MKHGSLFSGIGGFDLAAEWMGWENVFHCEINEFGRRILKYYWPNAISYEDITKTDFSVHRGGIDILTGGFPCQPYSTAGKRLGKDDERHLWPEKRRAIREIKSRWIVGENVRGLISWNGGMVFDEVQSDLEAEGYEVIPFLLPACGVNAPHRRDRIWFVAHAKSNENIWGGQVGFQPKFTGAVVKGINTNSSSEGLSGNSRGKQPSIYNSATAYQRGKFSRAYPKENVWSDFPTQSPVCTGNDGLSSRLERITFSKWRNESIKGAGNAIVPQVALQIFKAIEEYDRMSNPPAWTGDKK